MPLAPILALFLGFSAICYLMLGARVAAGMRDTGSVPLGITFAVISIWVMGGAIEVVATTHVVFSIGHLGHYVGTALVPVTLLICFRQYTGAATSAPMIAALLIVPLCSILIAASNDWHGLMWRVPDAAATADFVVRSEEWGPWFLFVHAPYGYSITAASIITLLAHSTAVAPAQRRGIFLLAGSAATPIIGAIVYDLGIGIEGIPVVPLVFAAMMPIYAWLIIGERIIEYTPLAYETVYQNMQDPVIVIDDKQKIIGLNRGAEAMLNTSEQKALRESLESVFGDDVPEVYQALETGQPQKMLTTTGRFLHLQVTAISTNEAASRTGRVLMFRDVSDVERAQKEVQASEKLMRTLIDHSVNGVLRLHWERSDFGGRILRCTFANSAAGAFLNVTTDDLVNRTAPELIATLVAGMGPAEAQDLQQRFEIAGRNEDLLDTEVRVEWDGRGRWLRIIAEPVGDDIAVTLIDITDHKAEELRMESIASSDPLTGVLNRRGFEREAAKRLTESSDDASGALLFVDLNDFKQINDTHGHAVGDQLLTVAAQRLKTGLRSCDIIGRPGGDEFVALVPDVTGAVAGKLAQRLTQSLEQPYLIGPGTLECSASIGLALYPADAKTLTGLMRAADQAMYRAKARARGETEGDTDLLEKAI